jgi:hypothetical protein
MDVVYATATTHVTTDNGARIVVHKGQHWPANDPVVRAQPSLFSDDPRYGMAYSVEPAGYDAPPGEVEQATAAPGERRSRTRTAS